QMPSSICARVPQKTRIIASKNSATVNLSDASALAPRSSHDSSRARADAEGPGRGGWPKAGGRFPVTDVLLIAASVEANGTDELLERELLLADQVRPTLHLEDPGLVAVRQHDDQE